MYTEQIADFERPFEITRRLSESVSPEYLLGYNFNRYSIEGDDNRPHFTIRLNLTDVAQKTHVNEQMTRLQTQGIIDDFTDDNPLVHPPFRDLSINHHNAHELSTQCAFRFYENKVQDLHNFNRVWRDRVDFLTIFLPRWLKYSGYLFNGVEGVIRSNILCIEELANECGNLVSQINMDALTDISVFNQRLVHTFFNCISNLRIEEQVYNNVALLTGYESFNTLLDDLTFA